MIEDRTVGLAISGDPARQPLSQQLYRYYSSYHYLDEVALYYRRNPALAFNAAARKLKTELLVCLGGDVYIGEVELFRFIRLPYDVPFALAPLYPRRHTVMQYPEPWSVHEDKPFVSGLFRVAREHLHHHPMPTSPSFSEDVLWERSVKDLGLTFGAVHVPCVHVDHHLPVPRLRKLVWSVIAPERFGQKGPARGLWQAIRTTVWDFSDSVRGASSAHEARDLHFVRGEA